MNVTQLIAVRHFIRQIKTFRAAANKNPLLVND
jgi:hypothetical protein